MDDHRCRMCDDCLPQYGVAPHAHIFGGKLGAATELLSESDWPRNFEPDPDAHGLGVYHCPFCEAESAHLVHDFEEEP